MAVDTTYAPYVEPGQDLAQAALTADRLVKGGARRVQIGMHGVTLDQLDATWQLELVCGEPNFVTARKKFGAIEIVCYAVKEATDES